MDNNVFLNLIKDKESLLKYLFSQMSTSAKICESLPKLKERGFSDEGVMDKLTEVTALQSKQIMLLTQLMLIYTQDNDFNAHVAKMLVKMGRGDDALRAMFEAKLKNK